MDDPLPELTAELRTITALPEVPLNGPRRWWGGPLDVEGLALASVAAAASAAAAVTGHRLGVRADLVAGAFSSIRHTRIDGRKPEGFAPLSGFFPASDGWLRTHANYPHHAAVLERLYGATDAPSLAAALAGVAAADAEHDIDAAGGAAARVRTAQDWRGSAPARAVDGSGWIEFDVGERADAEPLVPTSGGLDGVRVLDLTRVIAGPTATQLLAQLGADVLRVDPPGLPELVDMHVDRNAGKRTTLLDARDLAHLAVIDDLVARADVVVTGYRPGALAHLGLDAGALRERRADLVVAEFSAWGFDGAWAGRRGFDSIVQAATGIADAYRHDDGTPGALPVQALDYATGFGIADAVCALLHRRAHTGLGGSARMSLARTAHLLLDQPSATDALSPSPVPVIRRLDSPYGPLDLAAPAVTRDDAVMEHTAAPDDYGTAEPRFLS